MQRLLFVTWDGPGQSYLPSLFFPIFSQLSARGWRVDVLQNTFASPEDIESASAAAVAGGLRYTANRVPPSWRRFGLPAIIADGARRIVRLARQERIDALFPRSLIPAAMALLAHRLAPELRLVFDADGLMADERVDFAGLSPRSISYRLLRDVEAQMVRRAAAVIVRTQRARAILSARAGAGTEDVKFFVVPNGKDAAVFAPKQAAEREAVRRALSVGNAAPWIVYVGALGPQYYPAAMLSFVSRVREHRPDVRFTIFTRHRDIATELTQGSRASGVEFASLPPESVPDVIAAADLGLALRAMTFSQAAVSPIKVAEYLLCGTPVVSTGVGDLESQLVDCAGALLVSEPSATQLEHAARWFIESVLPDRDGLRTVCRDRGLRWFSLERCADGYDAALRHAFSSDG